MCISHSSSQLPIFADHKQKLALLILWYILSIAFSLIFWWNIVVCLGYTRPMATELLQSLTWRSIHEMMKGHFTSTYIVYLFQVIIVCRGRWYRWPALCIIREFRDEFVISTLGYLAQQIILHKHVPSIHHFKSVYIVFCVGVCLITTPGKWPAVKRSLILKWWTGKESHPCHPWLETLAKRRPFPFLSWIYCFKLSINCCIVYFSFRLHFTSEY